MTTTARMLNALRRLGFAADVCERWIPQANNRKDLFGILDIVAIRRGDTGVLGIQARTVLKLSARRQKAQAATALRTGLAVGNRFEIWGWSERNGRWEARYEALSLPRPRGRGVSRKAENTNKRLSW
ncbi:MAG TPA: hypothetical protein VGZ47_00950 [Gemmataceae bacterium]|jgi:hypothetical protein|nr:hypothetical protein [Gemmataceae bacterium]